MLRGVLSEPCWGWACDKGSSLVTSRGGLWHSGVLTHLAVCKSGSKLRSKPWQERDPQFSHEISSKRGPVGPGWCPFWETDPVCLPEPSAICCALALPASPTPHSFYPSVLSLLCETGPWSSPDPCWRKTMNLSKSSERSTTLTNKRVSELPRTAGKVLWYYSL